MHPARHHSRLLLTALFAVLCVQGAAAADSAIDSLLSQVATYKAHMNRDPYDVPRDGPGGVGIKNAKKSSTQLELETASFVGVMSSNAGFMALVEDRNTEGYALHVGDRVKRGKILEITESYLRAWIRVDGIGQRIRLDLVQEGE
jgi:Tfp pilus assembly protein PilP